MPPIFNNKNKARGFTLLELLIAVSVFSVMSVMAYGGLSSVIANSSHAERELNKIQATQHAMFTMTRDFTQVIPRTIRDEYGETQPHLKTSINNDTLVEFTRNGRRNPAGLLRSNLMRVAYKYEDEKLIRLFWPQLDRAQGVEPYEDVLLRDVKLAELRFLDRAGAWHNEWPPLNSTNSGNATKLRAVEFKIELKGWGELTRIYMVGS